MEAIQHLERHCRVTYGGPWHSPVEMSARIPGLLRSDLERVGDPQRQVAHYQKRDEFSARFAETQGLSVAAPSHTVHDKRSLQQNLNDLEYRELVRKVFYYLEMVFDTVSGLLAGDEIHYRSNQEHAELKISLAWGSLIGLAQ